MSGAFAGQTVLVAGGTGGLGRAVSLAFLAAGRGRRRHVPQRRRSSTRLRAPRARTRRARLEATRWTSRTKPRCERLVARIVASRHGRLDVARQRRGRLRGRREAVGGGDDGSLDQMLSAQPALRLRRSCAPRSRRGWCEQGRGAIVNVVSRRRRSIIAAGAGRLRRVEGGRARPDSIRSPPTSRAPALRANSILPSIIDTEANRKAMPKADFAKWPKPEEIARVILFLCSDDGRVVHGAAVPVYGDS